MFLTLPHVFEVGYYLDEERNWAMDVAELERSINVARREQNLDVKAIVIINPGNPTGQVRVLLCCVMLLMLWYAKEPRLDGHIHHLGAVEGQRGERHPLCRQGEALHLC